MRVIFEGNDFWKEFVKFYPQKSNFVPFVSKIHILKEMDIYNVV